MLDVDYKGLAKLMERKGPEWLVYELVQNAMDTETTTVQIRVEKLAGRPRVNIEVIDDDPKGFKFLSHAWTLFAESDKKGDPEKRGRFNLGEKLVLAYTVAHGGTATISTTSGTVRFNQAQGRTRSRKKRERGSAILLKNVKLNQSQYAALVGGIYKLIPPESIKVTFDEGSFALDFSDKISRPHEVTSFECTLPTERSDEEGILRRTKRKTTVTVFDTNGGSGWIYEMGIPVVETDDKYHIDVGQKIPLNMDRDNVTPAYLRQLRTEVLNHTFEHLTKEDTTESWVREASSDERADNTAVTKVLDLQFGKKRVAYDPSDPEGSKLAMSEGYAVVHGGSLSAGQWDNVRRGGSLLPAGRVTPSPKVRTSPDGKEPIPEHKWTKGMRHVHDYCTTVGKYLIGSPIVVRFYAEVTWNYAASFGGRTLTFNKGKLGNAWFNTKGKAGRHAVNKLLIHELGHYYSNDHLSSRYHNALCELGTKLAEFAANGRMHTTWDQGK